MDPFETYTEEYDAWFDRYKYAYLSELELVKQLLPSKGDGLEIGVGTGRFAGPLHIKYGIDPSGKMLEIAEKRGVTVAKAVAEKLPFENEVFDFILLTTTLCFLSDIEKALSEIYRVLKPSGKIILGFVDKDSFLGKHYFQKKTESKFYAKARFYSANDILVLLKNNDFKNIEVKQTLFSLPGNIVKKEIIKDGHGEGGFIGIKAEK